MKDELLPAERQLIDYVAAYAEGRMDHGMRVDPAVCHGQACIRGTRIPVTVVLDSSPLG